MDDNPDAGKAARIVCIEEDAGAPAIAVAERLAAHVESEFGPRDEKPLSVFAYGPDGALVAGLNGATHWRWLYVRNLWTHEGRRGQGLGAALLAEAERRAKARGCIGAYIDSFDPDSAAFYERRGFSRFGAIEDFPPGARRIFLMKRLDTPK